MYSVSMSKCIKLNHKKSQLKFIMNFLKLHSEEVYTDMYPSAIKYLIWSFFLELH